MGWVECKSVWLLDPEFANDLVGSEALKGLVSSGEVIGCDGAGQLRFKLFVGVVEEGPHGSFLDGSVHSFDLPVGPAVVWLGKPVFDSMQEADPVEGMASEACGWSLAVFRQIGELDALVGQHGVDASGTASNSALRKAAAARMSTFSTSSTTANFEVRLMATKR